MYPACGPTMTGEFGERTLVQRAQCGDQRAFDALVRKYRQRLIELSMRYTRNRADAEDAVQDAFIKAYSGLKNFRADSAFYSWLYRIAVNSAKTLLSARARNVNVYDVAGVSEGLKELDTPEELALTAEICNAVDVSIDALCEEQRTAILLREFQGLSYSQVASAMSCPVGTVRSRVFRAREAIDQHLRHIFDEGLRRAKGNASTRSRHITNKAARVGTAG